MCCVERGKLVRLGKLHVCVRLCTNGEGGGPLRYRDSIFFVRDDTAADVPSEAAAAAASAAGWAVGSLEVRPVRMKQRPANSWAGNSHSLFLFLLLFSSFVAFSSFYGCGFKHIQ